MADDELQQQAPEAKGAAGEASKGLKNLGGGEAPARELDQKKVQGAMLNLMKGILINAEQMKAKQAALAAIKVKKEDLDYLTKEFFMEREEAERLMKRHGGDLDRTLDFLFTGRIDQLKKAQQELKQTGKNKIYAPA